MSDMSHTDLFSSLNPHPPKASVDRPLPYPLTPRLEVPRDVWYLILPYLKRPRPAPLSRPARSEMRQPDLCATACVSKLFHEISEKLLYTDLFVEGLYHLAQSIDITDPSSNSRFRHTRHLHIDYWETALDPPYFVLMQDETMGDLFPLCGRMRNVIDHTSFWDCSREVGATIQALEILNKYGMAELFPNLRSVSVASVYGKENDRWIEFRNKCSDRDYTLISQCGVAFNIFLMSGKLQSVCLRDSNGPLCIAPEYYPSQTPKYSVALHFSEVVDRLYAPSGTPVRWASDIPMTAEYSAAIGVVSDSGDGIVRARKNPAGQAASQRAVDLAIHCSTATITLPKSEIITEGIGSFPISLPMSEERQRHTTRSLGEKLQEKLRGAGGGKKDVVHWYPSGETPICSSCQSGAPGSEEGEWMTGPYAVEPVVEDGGKVETGQAGGENVSREKMDVD